MPEIFAEPKESIVTDPNFQKFGIHVEHYIVSTGLTAMIKGSKVNQYVDGIWGCEFIDNTSKTRAVFEVNKDVNKNF